MSRAGSSVNLDDRIDALLLFNDSPTEAEIVKVVLDGFNHKLRDFSCDLDHASASGVAETMELLGSGLTKLHKLAVVVRKRPEDQFNVPASGLVATSTRLRRFWSRVSRVLGNRQGSTAALLCQLHQAFTAAERRAERGLREIADLHAQVMELQSTGITPLRNRITLMIQTNSRELVTTQSNISSTQQAIQTFDRSVRQQEECIRSLESKIDRTAFARTATGIAAHIVTLGIATLIAGGLPDPFDLEDNLAAANHARDEAQSQRTSTLYRISNLRDEESRLQQRLGQGRQLEGELPNLSNSAASIQSRCVTLQTKFSALKDTASRLTSRVNRVVGDMSVIKQAVTKEEFVALLLNLCNGATTLIDSDSRLVDEIEAVRGELAGYEVRLLGGIEDEWD